jgi:hypothetical protein
MSIDDEIARFDWSRIQTYLGHAEMVPGALRRLVAAPDDNEAARLGASIERILLSVAGPCEACAPVATVLVAALPAMTTAGHTAALDLLSIIGAAQITGPSHEQIGAVDVDEIRQAVAAGFHHYVAVLQTEASSTGELYPCVDLVDVAAFQDQAWRPSRPVRSKHSELASARDRDLMTLIDNTLDDLANLSSDSA